MKDTKSTSVCFKLQHFHVKRITKHDTGSFSWWMTCFHNTTVHSGSPGGHDVQQMLRTLNQMMWERHPKNLGVFCKTLGPYVPQITVLCSYTEYIHALSWSNEQASYNSVQSLPVIRTTLNHVTQGGVSSRGPAPTTTCSISNRLCPPRYSVGVINDGSAWLTPRYLLKGNPRAPLLSTKVMGREEWVGHSGSLV